MKCWNSIINKNDPGSVFSDLSGKERTGNQMRCQHHVVSDKVGGLGALAWKIG